MKFKTVEQYKTYIGNKYLNEKRDELNKAREKTLNKNTSKISSSGFCELVKRNSNLRNNILFLEG